MRRLSFAFGRLWYDARRREVENEQGILACCHHLCRLIIALAQEPSRPEQGVDPIQPVDPGFAYPNVPDTMDLGAVLVRSLSGCAVDEQGNVLLHHELRFLFPKS